MRDQCSLLFKKKMNDFFENKTASYFKSSDKFWKFYKSFIKTKKSSSSTITNIRVDDEECVQDPAKIANIFNRHFTNLKPHETVSTGDARFFINQNFANLKSQNVIKVFNEFKIKETCGFEVL